MGTASPTTCSTLTGPDAGAWGLTERGMMSVGVHLVCSSSLVHTSQHTWKGITLISPGSLTMLFVTHPVLNSTFPSTWVFISHFALVELLM